MKKFNKEADDRYPTFSICFEGTRFHWFNDRVIFDYFGLNATQYERMIRGETAERYDRQSVHRFYNKTPVFSNYSKNINFNSFYIHMNNFTRSINFASDNIKHDNLISHPNEWNPTKEPAMYKSHQTLDKICFSRESNDALNTFRLHDMITIDSSIIRFYNETQMDIFVHYPHQLIRSFENAKYSITFSHLQSILLDINPKVLEFKLTEIKRIKKRHNSNERCNPNITNYDNYLQQKMAEEINKEINCVPIYLKEMLPKENTFNVCHSPEKLKSAYQLLEDIKINIVRYEIPCDEMLVLTIDSINSNPIPIPDDIAIKFIYNDKDYEEIQYIRALGFENWLSNVGGFVGIFLGYSMMQIPEFLLIHANAFDRKKWSPLASMCKKLYLYDSAINISYSLYSTLFHLNYNISNFIELANQFISRIIRIASPNEVKLVNEASEKVEILKSLIPGCKD